MVTTSQWFEGLPIICRSWPKCHGGVWLRTVQPVSVMINVNELVCIDHSQNGAGWPGHNQTLLQFVYACVWWFLLFFFRRAMRGSVVLAETSMLSNEAGSVLGNLEMY